MKKIFKIVALINLMTLCAVSLSGCGSNGKTDKLVLALRSGTYAEVIKECLPGFEEKYGITCEVIEFSEDELHSELLNDSVNRRGTYDIGMVDGSWVAEFRNDQIMTDLTALGYSFDDDIIPATTTICEYEGSTDLVPYYGNVTVMLYNRTVAEDLGFDSDSFGSLDDILKLCKASGSSGHGGFVARGDTENNIVVDFLPILRAFGGWVVDSNNNPTVDTPEFKKALNYYIEFLDTGDLMVKDDLIKSIESGTETVAVGWPGWYSVDSINSDYIAFPGRVDGSSESYNSNIYGIWTLGITDNCKDKESALLLLEYLMDPEIQKSTVSIGGVPCRYSCLTDPELAADNPHLEVICSALENGIYRPVIQEWPGFYSILGEKMIKILNGEMTVDNGLMLAQEELEAMMNAK
jgi:ABC-type glycerol-3-phosphate transport system substrate-binding protein